MSRYSFILRLPVIVLIIAAVIFPVLSQAQTTARQVMLSSVYVDKGLVLHGQQNNRTPIQVTLWGITPFSNDTATAELSARIALEDLIPKRVINCTVKQWIDSQSIVGQCVNASEKDIALTLIEKGYALADKGEIMDTLFDTVYREAETKSRRNSFGLWSSVNALTKRTQEPDIVRAQNQTPFQITEDLAYVVITLMVAGPFIGMLIIALITYAGFRRLIFLQKHQMAVVQKKDRAMREREKFIVAASLEGEINSNYAKLEAFIIIYEELLKSLRNPAKEPKYRKSGDIIHEKPALSRNVYDSNIDKMDLLGQQIVFELTGLYTTIDSSPNYKTIDPETPIEDVINFVSKIIHDAETMLAPMDRISGALNVIVRDKRAKSSNPIP